MEKKSNWDDSRLDEFKRKMDVTEKDMSDIVEALKQLPRFPEVPLPRDGYDGNGNIVEESSLPSAEQLEESREEGTGPWGMEKSYPGGDIHD